MAIADADGAEAVSMRRIAQVLRSGAMTLYWHVASKEHLLELMLDTLMAELEVPGASGDWRADLQAQARSTRSLLLHHRWVMEFILSRPAFGPNTLRTQREQEQLDISAPQFLAGLAAWREKLAATGQFGHFLRMLSDNIDPDAAETRDERFEFGLDCVLDGIAAKLARIRGPAS